MAAICFKCAEHKAEPLAPCGKCHAAPRSDDEVAKSFMLTSGFLKEADLAEAAQAIRSGFDLAVPPELRAALVSAIRAARQLRRPAPEPERFQVNWKAVGVLAVLGVIVFLIFHPWAHFQWVSFSGSASSYEGFLSRFPSGSYASEAKEKLRILREDDVWRKVQAGDQLWAYFDYLAAYPDGKYITPAKERVTVLEESAWNVLRSSRDVNQLRDFISLHPYSSKRAFAETRIKELQNDVSWVKEKNDLETYRQFVRNNPTHPERAWMDRRIIDLEVAKIATGEHSPLPRSERVASGSDRDDVVMNVQNETEYTLTILYSGKDSKRVVISAGASETVRMAAGSYKVAASVDKSGVVPYYGTDELSGQHSSRFFIRRTTRRW